MQTKQKEQGQFALGVLICFAVAAVAVVPAVVVVVVSSSSSS